MTTAAANYYSQKYGDWKMAWSDGKIWLTLDDVEMVIKNIFQGKTAVSKK